MHLYYINLDSRKDRRDLMIKNWITEVDLNRVSGVKIESEKFGAKGCFEAHKKAFEVVKKSGEISIIAEDDIIPTSDFKDKLLKCAHEVPDDWNILMVGFNVSERSKFVKVSDRIALAQEHITAGHCYIVNPDFYEMFESELNNPENGSNLDMVFINLQKKKYKVYMCVPTLCYQYSSFSDNSNRVVGNTESTKKYFEE